MARLLMHWLQFEYGLIPSRILNTDKEPYIKALVATRDNEDFTIFRRFMATSLIWQLRQEIDTFIASTGIR